MKSKNIYKNKKLKKTRSKKGAGLFNTQKIVDSAECQPVKQLSNYQTFSADKAFDLYNKCCPKSSVTGKANYNFKCKNLYQTYLNKTKQVAPAQPVALNEDDEVNEDYYYNNNIEPNINKNGENVSQQFTDALIEEQTYPRDRQDSFIEARRVAAAAKPKEQYAPNPTYIQNLKAYGLNEKYKELSEKYPEGSYKPDEEKKKWYQFWRKTGGKTTLRKKTKKTKKTKNTKKKY
jgi:hypothetical protein